MGFGYYWCKLVKKLRGSAIKNSIIHATSKVESGSQIVNSVFNKHSFCGYDCDIINTEIGSFCSIANNVKIGGGMHPISWVSMSPVFYSGRDSVKAKLSEFDREPVLRTVVGSDVWIGESVIVKQGVTIGHGAVVGMGSIVTKDVAPYSIVGGNPARLIKMRFDQHIIEKMLNSKWWEMDENKLKKHAEYIKDPEAFFKSIEG